MIGKDKLLDKINALIELEKRLPPLLNKHISSSLIFSDLKEDVRNGILEQFQNRSAAQIKHIEILKDIKNDILKSKKDVY